MRGLRQRRGGAISRLDSAVGLVLGLALFWLAAWQLDGLGAGWTAAIPHGVNEDWDWQLTLWELGRTALRDGHLPEWNAYTGGGQPAWANPEQPFLYPGYLLTLGLSTEHAIRVLTLAHQGLAILGFWMLGRSWGLRGWSAHAASLLLLTSAFLPGFVGWGHIMFLPIGWLPLALVAAHRKRWWLSGFCLAMPALAGGHYLAVYGVLWLVADGLARSVEGGRLRWLALALAANGLMLGLPWWTAAPLVAAALLQRSGRSQMAPVAGALGVAALLSAPKWLPVLLVAPYLERFGQVHGAEIADPYTLGLAVDVLRGAVERPSGHEGQNVFWTVVPLLGVPGLLWAAWRKPAMAAPLWLLWCFGWAGSTPLNLFEPVHALPGVSSLRVVERFALLWTPALGFGLGFLVDRLRWAAVPVAGALAWHVSVAAPQAAGLQRLGPGPEVTLPAGEFKQTRDELTNLQALRANRGKVDCTSAAALTRPAPVLAVTDLGYRGEAWNGRGPVDVLVEGDLVVADVAVTLNQSWFPGWPGEPDEHGFVVLPSGGGEYRAPGLNVSWGPAALAPCLALLLAVRRLRGRGPSSRRGR